MFHITNRTSVIFVRLSPVKGTLVLIVGIITLLTAVTAVINTSLGTLVSLYKFSYSHIPFVFILLAYITMPPFITPLTIRYLNVKNTINNEVNSPTSLSLYLYTPSITNLYLGGRNITPYR